MSSPNATETIRSLTTRERLEYESLRHWYLGGFELTDTEKAKAMEWVVTQYLEDVKADATNR